MVLDLFTFENPEKNPEEVGEEEIQPEMAICPEVVYCHVQVNLFQKHLFLHQLTHNMTKDCSLTYQFST